MGPHHELAHRQHPSSSIAWWTRMIGPSYAAYAKMRANNCKTLLKWDERVSCDWAPHLRPHGRSIGLAVMTFHLQCRAPHSP